MGENKGHGDKAPNYPELDQQGSAAQRAGQSAGNLQSAGTQPDTGNQKDSSMQQGSGPSGKAQSGNRDDQLQQGSGSQQHAGGQQQPQQKGGQHASGGTPALDDLNADLDSRNRGSLGNAAQQMDQTSGWDGQQDQQR